MATPLAASQIVGRSRKTGASPAARLDVLVLDAQYRQSLAAMKSYARRGLRVGAVACEDKERPLAFASRYCRRRFIAPSIEKAPEMYVDGVLAAAERHGARMLLPAHDGTVEALRERRADLAGRVAVPLASERSLKIVTSKERTRLLAEELRVRVPRTIVAATAADAQAAANQTGYPVVIKPDSSWATAREQEAVRLYASIALDAGEAYTVAAELLAAGAASVQVQEWLPGRREAVTLFYADEQVRARFAQVSWRDWPVIGGASVLYESLPLLPELVRPAEALVRAADLEGCSLVEFRRDARGRPCLMEINPRMGGSAALPLRCGVDFPYLLYAWATGQPLQPVGGYLTGRRLRWLAADIRRAKAALSDPSHPDSGPRAQTIATFLFDFLRRPAGLDPFDITDLRPALLELNNEVFQRLHRWPGAGQGPRR